MEQLFFLNIQCCGIILNKLEDKMFDDIKSSYSLLQLDTGNRFNKNLIAFGLFFLCNDTHILSIAVVRNAKLDRIYTFPAYRNQGYASKLLHMIVKFGIEYGITYFSPIDNKVRNLFERQNWIPVIKGDRNPDGTQDYCHKLFHKQVSSQYPTISLRVTEETVFAFLERILPTRYLKSLSI